MTPLPQTYSQTPTFNWHNADTPIKIEKELVINDGLLERCIEDRCLRAPFVGQVEGHPLGLQDDDDESSSCFSSQYLPREVFETSSFATLLSNPPLYSEEQQDAGFGNQNTPMEYASQPTRQGLHALDMYDDTDVASTTSFRPRTRRSTPRSALCPATRSSSRLQNLRNQGLGHQRDYEDDQQRDYRESSVASTVMRRFSDLSLMSAASSPLVQISSAPFSTPAAGPTTTAATTSFSATSAVYFPPTASALHQKRRKVLKQELRVPRPKNCFMLYRSKVLPMIMAELGNINNKIISKIAAERWRAESELVKTWYRDMAKFGKDEHARNNPGYKYAPLNKMRSMAATALSHLTQSQHSSKMVTSTATRDFEDVDVNGNNSGGDKDYVDGSSSTRRRSARQRHQRHQPATRSGLRSQVSKRRNSNLASEIPSPSRNKRPRDSVDNHVGYSPMNFSTDSFPSLASTKTTGLRLFAQQYQHQESAYQPHPLDGPSHPLPVFPYGAPPYTTTSAMTSSIYGLSGDKNASEITLVDPIDHWTNHQYHEAPSYFDQVNLSPTSTTLLSSHSVVQKSKMTAAASLMSPSQLMMIDPKILMEKELPPLPHEMETHSDNNFYATNKSSHLFRSKLNFDTNVPGLQPVFPTERPAPPTTI
ncbi:hypothetical protein EC957_006172 [Mortierella hygrophila]|uniref:HMG box domain-containing protein n=1 Tax=Mortierella hygrophila TaxID=979708 RepID=A0A9P6EZF7_9FUNG|nr:hypothetical protein EC957_006172 [Mortierella hygrophila]